MKKITFLFCVLLLFCSTVDIQAQILNQPANWPNTNWSVTGSFNTDPAAFEADPTVTSNFAFDDDDSGNGVDDDIAAESPIIDLTAAFTAGETWLEVNADYVYNNISADRLSLQYWDADGNQWLDWGTPLSTDTAGAPNDNFCSATPEAFNFSILNIAGFTATQQSGFRYRIAYDDNNVWAWGFCVNSPTITSQTPPSCPDPSALTVTGVTDTTADLAWTENGSASAWDIEIVDITAGGTPTGTATNTGVTNPYNVMGLTAQNDYEYYVRANCGGSGTSNWVGPFAFTTACSFFTAPYTEDFSAFTTSTAAFTSENCWTGTGGAYYWESAPGTDNGSTGTGPDPTITTGNYFYTEASAGSAGDTTDLISPLVDLTPLSAPSLSFDYHMFGNQIGTLDILVNGTDNVFSISGEQQTSATDPWVNTIIDLSAYNGQTISVTFRATSAGIFEGDISIDNIVFDEAPSCIAPNSLSVSPTSTTDATITWMAGSTETQWTYDFGVSPYTQGTNSSTVVNTTPSINLSSLTPGETYEIFIQANCGGGNGDSTYITIQWTQPNDGDTCALAIPIAVESDCSAATPYTIDYALAVDLGTSDLSCDPTGVNTGAWFSFTAPSTGDIIVNTSDSNEILIIDACGGTDILCNNIPAVSNDVLGLIPGNTYYLAVWKDGATTGTTDVCIEEILCSDPSNLSVTNITTNSAELSWTDNAGASAWNIELVDITAGGTATGTATETGVTNPFIAMGLAANNNYEYYVQADCGSSQSGWVGPFSFTTACVAFMAPYTEDFSTFTTSGAAFTSENCWTGTGGAYYWESAPGTDIGSTGTGPDPSITTGNYFYTEASAGSAGDTTDLISPLVDLSSLTSPSLSFDYHMYGIVIGTLDILVNGTDNVFSISGEQQTSATDPWVNTIIDLSAYSGQTISVTFRGTSAGIFEGDIAIDNVVFDELPTCVQPSSLTAAPTSSTDATITWTAGGTETQWTYDFGIDPYTQGTNASTVVNTTPSINLTGLTAGETYTLFLQANCGVGDSSYISVTWTQPPLGDDLCDAIPLTVDAPGVASAYSNVGATTQTNEPDGSCYNGGAQKTVWFTFTAAQAGDYTISTDIGGTLDDSEIALFDATGVTCADLSTLPAEIDCDQDGGTVVGNGWMSIITATLSPGTYYVQVSGYNNAEGDFGIEVTFAATPTPPANDDCAIATMLTPGGVFADNPVDGTVAAATADNATPASCGLDGPGVWYSVMVPASGSITFEVGSDTATGTTGFDSVIEAFSGSCGALTSLGCDDDGAATGNYSQLSLNGLNPGDTIYLRVWEFGGDETEPFSVSAYDASLSSDNLIFEGFKYYPNPVNNELNLSARSTIDTVVMYNLLGQEVLRNNPNDLSTQINMNGLQNGAYFVQVNIGGAVKTIRVLKE